MSITFVLPAAFRGATALPRPALEQLIEQLVDMLDVADGDPDLEDDDPAEDNHDREAVFFG